MKITRSGSQPVGQGEQHWHGASPTAAMQLIAIQEALDGKAVNWMERVTDAKYTTRP